MKNKKGVLQMTMGTMVTIVLLTIVLILAGYFISTIFDKSDFKITKEECVNVTGEYSGYDCSDNSSIIGGYFEEYELESFTFKDGRSCSKIHETFIKEVCEQVDVDEIEINTIPENISCFGEDCEKLWIKNISKSDLSTEWLDENCECEKTKEGYRLDKWELIKKDCEYGYEYSCELLKGVCEEYSCGENYIVEVLE